MAPSPRKLVEAIEHFHHLREALKRASELGQTQLVASVERDLRQLEAIRD
jgi:hypothetical protein